MSAGAPHGFVFLLVCFGIGLVAARLRLLPDATPHVLNRLVLQLALPALVLRSIHRLPLQPGLWAAPAMIWLVFLLAYLLFFKALRARLGDARAGTMALTSGLCNTAFVGLPMVEQLLGPAALGPAVLADQLGSFLVLSTWGVWTAARASGSGLPARTLFLRVLAFPPFAALVLAALTRRLPFPAALDDVLGGLSGLVTPLALLSVGLQLELKGLWASRGTLALGLLYKLLVAPAAVALVLVALKVRGLVLEATVLQAGMAPMVTGGIVAAEYGLDGRLAALMVGTGVPLSFATAPLIAHGLKTLFG